MLSWGSLDLGFGFGFGVPEAGVGLDGASASRSLRRLDFRVRYLAMGGGHVCYALSRGSLDPEFGFGFKVLEAGVGLDGASPSGSLHRLNFCVRYLVMGGGHITGCDDEASDWKKGDEEEWRSNMKEFIQQ